jgi:DNA-binding transcriptional LysR family regulator
LLAVVPRHLIAAIGLTDLVIGREMPFDLPPVHVDMLWHERHARDPAHRWIRDMLYDITGGTRIQPRQLSEEMQLTEERQTLVRTTSHK